MGSYASNYHQEHERLSLPSRPCWLLLVQHAVAWEAEADDAAASSPQPLHCMPASASCSTIPGAEQTTVASFSAEIRPRSIPPQVIGKTERPRSPLPFTPLAQAPRPPELRQGKPPGPCTPWPKQPDPIRTSKLSLFGRE